MLYSGHITTNLDQSRILGRKLSLGAEFVSNYKAVYDAKCMKFHEVRILLNRLNGQCSALYPHFPVKVKSITPIFTQEKSMY